MIMSIKRATNTVTWIVRRWHAALSPKLIAITVSEADLQPPKLARIAESESHPSMLTIDIIGTLKATFRMGDRILATVKRPMRPARSRSDRFSKRLGERSERARLFPFFFGTFKPLARMSHAWMTGWREASFARRSRRRANGTTSRLADDREAARDVAACQNDNRAAATSGERITICQRWSWPRTARDAHHSSKADC